MQDETQTLECGTIQLVLDKKILDGIVEEIRYLNDHREELPGTAPGKDPFSYTLEPFGNLYQLTVHAVNRDHFLTLGLLSAKHIPG